MMHSRNELARLVAFNCQVLDQALAVLAAHDAKPTAAYAPHTGPHLRHIIEHYEALTLHPGKHSVDYDTRARDRAVERDAAVARDRLQAIRAALQQLSGSSTDGIMVIQRGGLDGNEHFTTPSTLGRELMFLASHAVHHYAVIQNYCRAQGIDLGPGFGKAPATVQHELSHAHALTAAA